MSDISSLRHDPPPTPIDRVRIAWLVFAIAGPPLAWDLQLLILSAFTGYACYPGDYAVAGSPGASWPIALKIVADSLAILVAVAAGIVSWRYLLLARQRIADHPAPLSLWHLDRVCFMALGGILSAMGFLVAVIFETIASFMVQLCNP